MSASDDVTTRHDSSRFLAVAAPVKAPFSYRIEEAPVRLAGGEHGSCWPVVGKFVERGAPVIYALPTDFGWKVVRLDEPRQVSHSQLLGNGFQLLHVTWPRVRDEPLPGGG